MTEVLTAEQLAQALQVNPEQIRRLTRLNAIPYSRISPNVVRYVLTDVMAATRVNKSVDDEAVDQFAAAMRAKMAAAAAKGREGWDDPEQQSPQYLAEELVRHVAKGDPVDVGNFAMMLHARGVDADVLAGVFGCMFMARPQVGQ